MIDGSCTRQIVLQKNIVTCEKWRTKNELSNVMKDKFILTLIRFGELISLDTYVIKMNASSDIIRLTGILRFYYNDILL